MTKGNDTAYGYGFTTADGSNHSESYGLTKREYFAAMALQGVLASGRNNTFGNGESISQECVKIADYLITALNTQQ